MFGHRSVLLLLVVLVVECFAFDWKSCGTGEAKFSVKDVTLTPEPVSPGSTAVFTINATSGKPADIVLVAIYSSAIVVTLEQRVRRFTHRVGVPVQAGQISMTVQYAGFPIWTQEDSLCTKMTCPATAGPVAVVFQQQFPVITPPVRARVAWLGLGVR